MLNEGERTEVAASGNGGVDGLRRLKAIRGGNRATVTKLEREVYSIIEGMDGSRNTNELNTRLSSIAITLKDKQIRIDNLDQRILDSCDLEEIEKEVEEATDVNRGINTTLMKIEQVLNGKIIEDRGTNIQARRDEAIATNITLTPRREEVVQPNLQSTPRQEDLTRPAENPNLSLTSNVSSANQVRLPKITLPRFNGDIKKYQPFWQSFKAAVEDNESLSNIHKLNYLISSLEGKAYTALEGLDITAENYENAKKLLKDRFGKTQQIISAHMNELLILQSSPNGTTAQLRAIYDSIQVHIRGLESLGVSSEKYGSLLIPVIMSRMPSEIALQVARKTTEDVWSITEIMGIIQKEIEAREVSRTISVKEHKTERAITTNAGTTRTFISSTRSKVIQCYFCKKGHYASECAEIKDIQKRKEILKASKRCFICLKLGHIAKVCESAIKCKVCSKRHNTVICEGGKETENKKIETQERNATTMASKGKEGILLQTAQAIVYGEDANKKTRVNILFDGGSQRSYVTEELRKKLGLKGEIKETVNVNTFGTSQRIKYNSELVRINVEVEGEVVPIKALSFPTICSPIANRVSISEHAHLAGLKLADRYDHKDKNISILIGANHYFDFITGETIKGSNGPTAVSSKLGWLLSGPVLQDNENDTHNNVASNLVLDIIPSRQEIVDESQEITDSLDRFWKQESCGLVEDEITENARNQETENDAWKMDIKFKERDSKYEVSLPWKFQFSDERLDSHYELSKKRLHLLHERLRKNPDLLKEYDDYFKDQIAKGIIEVVPEANRQGNLNVHYLCHHGVIRRDRETTKLRVVFDGSAKDDKYSPSLNDRLEVGKNYMPLLFDTLVRFRMKAIALTADIEKAFLQIQISESDKDKLRFLWFDDVSKSNPSVIELRHNRLVFGLTSSPSILGETIRQHVAKYEGEYPEVCRVLKRLYADDLSCVANTKTEALELYDKSKMVMNKGGFNLRKWVSNDKEVMREINEIEQRDEGKTNELKPGVQVEKVGLTEGNGKTKILGVNWNSDLDVLVHDVKGIIELAENLPVTKRSLLKIAAKIFDPLGILSSFTINLKALFQELCVNKVGWDNELQDGFKKEYHKLVSELKGINDISVKRCVFIRAQPVRKIEIHGFSDASEKAQGCVVYLRIIYESGKIDNQFLASKAKVNPIKQQTIPRLELSAAVLMSKLVSNLREIISSELDLTNIETYYWVDSVATLCWIKNNKAWTNYVANRVREILKVSQREQWFYCPGPKNPADMPSRGNYKKCFEANSFWWEGPLFLKGDPKDWPTFPEDNDQSDAMKEKLKNSPLITHAMFSGSKTKDIIDMDRFSNKNKLVRTFAWVWRFISNMRNKGTKDCESKLSLLEIENAEKKLIRIIQNEAFENEINYLNLKKQERNPGKMPLYVNQFNLYIDKDNILRCRSRIGKANVPDESKRPILLPAKTKFSELIVKECHSKVMHNGINDTLCTMREKFWILRGREVVKKVLRRCITCKRQEGLPYKTMFSPDLPEPRVDDGPPFKNVGVDFAGPLIVDGHKGEMKCYVCLFTCASTRAVHLELVESLDVESFIRAFRRFASRRGLPSSIISDNAKTYKAASKEIRKLRRSPRLQEYLECNRVTWKFIIELAPWQGGMWERMIKSVKRCINKVIGQARLNYYELTTILVEVESVVNSRPLTYVEDDEGGVSYALTPSHLINGRNLFCIPSENVTEIVSTYEELSKRGRYHRKLLTHFTNRWKREYLSALLQAYRPKDSGKEPVINVNDIVLLRNDQQKRNFWKLGKIIQLIKGTDGSVRAAKLQVGSLNGKKVINRALKLLIPLEVTTNESSKLQATVPCEQSKQAAAPRPPDAKLVRPRRNAAIIGELIRKDNL